MLDRDPTLALRRLLPTPSSKGRQGQTLAEVQVAQHDALLQSQLSSAAQDVCQRQLREAQAGVANLARVAELGSARLQIYSWSVQHKSQLEGIVFGASDWNILS